MHSLRFINEISLALRCTFAANNNNSRKIVISLGAGCGRGSFIAGNCRQQVKPLFYLSNCGLRSGHPADDSSVDLEGSGRTLYLRQHVSLATSREMQFADFRFRFLFLENMRTEITVCGRWRGVNANSQLSRVIFFSIGTDERCEKGKLHVSTAQQYVEASPRHLRLKTIAYANADAHCY